MAQPHFKNNPLAPPWLWSSSACAPAGVRERYHQYVLRQPVEASGRISDQPFQFDGDGCFVIRVLASGADAGQFYIQWRDELGRYLTNQPVSIGGMCGGAEGHLPLPVTQTIPRGLSWTFNLEEVGGVDGSTVFYVLIGVKQLAGA